MYDKPYEFIMSALKTATRIHSGGFAIAVLQNEMRKENEIGVTLNLYYEVILFLT